MDVVVKEPGSLYAFGEDTGLSTAQRDVLGRVERDVAMGRESSPSDVRILLGIIADRRR